MNTNESTTIVIFGITGDLSSKKIMPALFNLWQKRKLSPKFKIVGFSRRQFSDRAIREEVGKFLPKTASDKDKQKFLSRVFYKQGVFDDQKSYLELGEMLQNFDQKNGECSNKLFYLAVPPNIYEMILLNLHKSGLHIHCGTEERQTKILIEKPFGNDLSTAKSLDRLLGRLFNEKQIYRIDHYLGKETLQNILTFRFSNTIFEPIWNSKNIDRVEIKLFEKEGINNRGPFYDKIGALRDVGQNHILAMLSLITMEKPKEFSSFEIRKEREKVVGKLRLPDIEFLKQNWQQAQYQGYLTEEGVAKDSTTETFFSVQTFLNNPRWRDTVFTLKSGKFFPESKTEIKIFFKDRDPKFFLPQQFKSQEVNSLTFRIQPDEGIEILFWVKVPGFEKKIEMKKLSFNYSDSKVDLPDAYEHILNDCIEGDQTLFPTTKEIMSQWKFIEEVTSRLKKLPLLKYKKGELS